MAAQAGSQVHDVTKLKQHRPLLPRHGIVASGSMPKSAGTVLPVASPDGSQGFAYQVSLGDLPSPAREFYAHVAHAERGACEIELAFGQRAAGRGQKEEVYLTLFINLALDHLPPFLDKARRSLDELERQLQGRDICIGQTAPFAQHPEHAVHLRANLIGMAFWGLEALLDFHHLSPWEYQKLSQGREPTVDQVVRVNLSAALCAALIRQLFVLGSSLQRSKEHE
jgi:hypothetical protein